MRRVTKDVLVVWFVPDKSRTVPLFALTRRYLTWGSGAMVVGCVGDTCAERSFIPTACQTTGIHSPENMYVKWIKFRQVGAFVGLTGILFLPRYVHCVRRLSLICN